MKKLLIPFAALLLLAATACKKDKTECGKAVVIMNAGPLEGDGCGWVAVIDSIHYHP